MPVPPASHLAAHVVPVLNGSPPLVAVAVSAQVAMLAAVVASEEAHAVLTEAVLPNHKTMGHVVVVPVATIGKVV